MKKKTIALFVLLFAAFLSLQTGTSAAESHIEAESEDSVMVEVVSIEEMTSELTEEERAALIKEIAVQIELLQQAVAELQVLVAQVIEARGATFVEAPVPAPTPVVITPPVVAPPVAMEDIEVVDLDEEDLFASIQESEEEVDVDALFAASGIDQDTQNKGGSTLLGTFGNPENRGAFVLIAAFIVGGILFALSRRKKGPKPVPQTTEQKVEPQPVAPTLDQAPWG